MPEAWAWHWQWHRQVLTGPQVGVKGNAAEGDDHLYVGQQAQLSEEIRLAVVDFLALGFIRRGRTVQHLRDETVVERSDRHRDAWRWADWQTRARVRRHRAIPHCGLP